MESEGKGKRRRGKGGERKGKGKGEARGAQGRCVRKHSLGIGKAKDGWVGEVGDGLSAAPVLSATKTELRPTYLFHFSLTRRTYRGRMVSPVAEVKSKSPLNGCIETC